MCLRNIIRKTFSVDIIERVDHLTTQRRDSERATTVHDDPTEIPGIRARQI